MRLRAFVIAEALLEGYGLGALFYPELRLLRRMPRMLDRLLGEQLPALRRHFQACGLACELFAISWFQTCFIYTPSITVQSINQILDIFVVERSFKIFFRVALAILKVSESSLLKMDMEGMMEYFACMPGGRGGYLEAEILLKLALSIKVTRSMIFRVEDEVIANEETNRGERSEQRRRNRS